MPYVKPKRRPDLDKVIDELLKVELDTGNVESFLYHLALNSRGQWPFILSSPLEKCRSIGVKPNGDINYILFKYCKYHVTESYNAYKSFMGEIYAAANRIPTEAYEPGSRMRRYRDEYREAAEWIRIKILVPYEEEKREENGDV